MSAINDMQPEVIIANGNYCVVPKPYKMRDMTSHASGLHGHTVRRQNHLQTKDVTTDKQLFVFVVSSDETK